MSFQKRMQIRVMDVVRVGKGMGRFHRMSKHLSIFA